MRATRSEPQRLYHSSPYRLSVGRSIRPRWCLHFGVWKVWMTSSLVEARQVGRAIVLDLQAGHGGFCGTIFPRFDLQPQQVFGAWVYRVKPTGPIERDRRSHWTTSFPVRVLQIVEVLGQPDRNRLTLPTQRSVADAAAVVAPDPEKLVCFYERWLATRASDHDSADIICDLVQGEMSWKEGAEVLRMLSSCPDHAQRLEAARQFSKRWVEKQSRFLASRQRRQHHKLSPDLRYRRSKSWKQRIEE